MKIMHHKPISFNKILQMQSDRYGKFWEFMIIRVLRWKCERVASLDVVTLHIPERFVE